MRRFLIVVLAFTAISFTGMAQGHFQLGLKLGFNSTTFNTDNASQIISGTGDYTFTNAKDDFKSGYLFGAYSRIGLFGNLSLQPELYFSKKSGVTDYTLQSDAGSVSMSEKVTYYSWDLPILAHLKIVDLKVVNLYGVAGPVISFKSDDKSKLSLPTDEFNEDRLSGANWNFQLGGGVEVWKFNFDVRYEWGLNDVSKTKLERKSNALMFSLGYRLFGI